eukprot:4073978-Pyramimonas_sp.AAC.1
MFASLFHNHPDQFHELFGTEHLDMFWRGASRLLEEQLPTGIRDLGDHDEDLEERGAKRRIERVPTGGQRSRRRTRKWVREMS